MACAVKSDPISQLEEDLECSVCLEVLKDPRTLPCCHSFCKDCLEGVVQTCRATAPDGRPIQEIPCPNCRAMFPLDPDKHVADMPRNHFICNLVKVTAVLDRGIGVPCSHNCSQSYSVARCVTCEKFLCRECLTDHNKYRGHNGHSILTMEELSKPENRKKIKDKMYCNEHSGKKLKVYCETCDQLICKDCMDFKHVKQEGHSCFLVKDVANNYKILLASNNKAMEDALTEGHVFTERLSLTTKQLDRDAQNAKMQMAKRKESIAKRVLKLLNEKAECLSKKVDEIHDGKRANLDRQTEETNQFVENIKTSVELSKKLVDQGTEEEIVSSQKMMLDNANNLLAKREEYLKAPIPVAKLGYTAHEKEPINQEILRGLTATLGEVNEDPGRIGKTLKIGREEGLWSSIGGEEKTHQSGRNIKEPDESFSLSSLFLRYIIAYHYEEYQKLENVSREISFEVSETASDRNLKIFARKDVDRNTFSKTVDKFIGFYQNQSQKMVQEIIRNKNWDLILEARAKFTVVIDSARDRNKMVIYGEKENVQKALKFLESKVATASTASSSSTLNDAASGSSYRGTYSGRLPSPEGGTGKKLRNESHFSEKPYSSSHAVWRYGTKKPDKPPAKGECSICLCDMTDRRTLRKCGHSFCAVCIDRAFKHKKKCPICSTVYGLIEGNQPEGNMYDSYQSTSLPGFASCGTITISYKFPSGTQGPEHPHPGKPYQETNQEAFLPLNDEGKKVFRLLRKAFEQKLTFTIGQSLTTGEDDCVVWNIPHKTSMTGGPTCFGYPDPDYLRRVQEDLAANGITE